MWEYSRVWACSPPRAPKCKKVIAWSADFSMDKYVSWGLSNKDLNLDTIWGKYEEFYKPQTNEVHAHFDLLTSFGKAIEVCMSGIMQYKHKSIWLNTPQKQLRSALWHLLVFPCMVRNLYRRPLIIVMSILRSFQLVECGKKMESSKATVCHIKQVVDDPQAVQINLMRHQCTEIPPGKNKKKKSYVKPK